MKYTISRKINEISSSPNIHHFKPHQVIATQSLPIVACLPRYMVCGTNSRILSVLSVLYTVNWKQTNVDTVEFFPKQEPFPKLSPDTFLCQVASDIIHILPLSKNNIPTFSYGDHYQHLHRSSPNLPTCGTYIFSKKRCNRTKDASKYPKGRIHSRNKGGS